ncbi:MAG: hypothetical protein LAT65_10030 [Saccharospirillum sp.]|nr:hypothetical protein [Saccharospirillum sp.]
MKKIIQNATYIRQSSVNKAAQKGSALLVSLVMLLLISIISVGAMQSSILQERMSSNMQDRELAFQAAEAALRDAENLILTQNLEWLEQQPFVYTVNEATRPAWNNNAFDNDGNRQSIANPIAGVSQQPEFFIETIELVAPGASTELGVEVPDTSYFRITSRGFGGTAQTVVVLTSVYRRQ